MTVPVPATREEAVWMARIEQGLREAARLAYREGYAAGLRRAAEIAAAQAQIERYPHKGDWQDVYEAAKFDAAAAILAECSEGNE